MGRTAVISLLFRLPHYLSTIIVPMLRTKFAFIICLFALINTPAFCQIHIGASAALTGASGALGHYYIGGADLAFEAHNARVKSPKKRIELTVYDDAYNPEKTLENTQKLIHQDNVDALFGYVGTPTVVRMLPLLKLHEKKNLKLYFPFTGANTLRISPYDKFVINQRVSYHQEIDAMVMELVKIGRKRIAVLYQSDAFGRDGWFGANNAAIKWGADIVVDVAYTRGMRASADFSPQVSPVLKAAPDAVICIGSYEAVAGFISAMRREGSDALIASISFVNPKALLNFLPQKELDGRLRQNLLISQVVPDFKENDRAATAFRVLVRKAEAPELLNEVAYEGYLAATEFIRLNTSPDKAIKTHKVNFITYQDWAWKPVKEWSKWAR